MRTIDVMTAIALGTLFGISIWQHTRIKRLEKEVLGYGENYFPLPKEGVDKSNSTPSTQSADGQDRNTRSKNKWGTPSTQSADGQRVNPRSGNKWGA